ncbi:MAG: cellulase family glycosylhydrolase [Anaerolineae bacterium]|nr:cellulase family glycosylhydrolase [Anaerolineae bacterium]
MRGRLPSLFPIPRWVLALTGVALLLALALGWASQTSLLRRWTGEEELLPQIRGVWHLGSGLLRPRPETADYVPVQHAGVNPFGVNTFLEQEVEPEKREQAVAMIAQAGFHWVRQEFPWEDIEIHGKGDFEDRRTEPHRSAWDKYDHIVDLAEAYGLELIVRLSNPPAWSRAAGNEGGTLGPPDDLADFGDFVETVVRRYRGRVRYYQIWNEPNIYPEWGEKPVNPEEYALLLREAYTRAKAVDPEVVIICGALAATIQNDLYPYGMSDFVFLQRLYDAGAAPYFDVLSMQGYGLWSGPYDRRMRPRVLNFSRPIYVRDLMVKNGDAHKPIWISEMNWNAIPPDHPAHPMFGRYSLEQQAEYVVEAYRRAQLEWPWVGVVNLWYFKRATDLEQDQPMYYFRMVEPDFTPMPVYAAVSRLAHSTSVVGLGLHQEDHWALHYQGDWRREEVPEAQLGTVMSTTIGSLALRWRGTDLHLTLRGPGAIEVQTDSHGEKRLELDGGWVTFPVATGLADAEHDTTIVVVGGTISVDALTVERHVSWVGMAAAAIALASPVFVALTLRLRARRQGGRLAHVHLSDHGPQQHHQLPETGPLALAQLIQTLAIDQFSGSDSVQLGSFSVAHSSGARLLLQQLHRALTFCRKHLESRPG